MPRPPRGENRSAYPSWRGNTPASASPSTPSEVQADRRGLRVPKDPEAQRFDRMGPPCRMPSARRTTSLFRCFSPPPWRCGGAGGFEFEFGGGRGDFSVSSRLSGWAARATHAGACRHAHPRGPRQFVVTDKRPISLRLGAAPAAARRSHCATRVRSAIERAVRSRGGEAVQRIRWPPGRSRTRAASRLSTARRVEPHPSSGSRTTIYTRLPVAPVRRLWVAGSPSAWKDVI